MGNPYPILSETAAIAAFNAIVNLIDAGSGPGVYSIMTNTGKVLIEGNLNKPSFQSPWINQYPYWGFRWIEIESYPINPVFARANGTAASCKISDSNGNQILTGNVGLNFSREACECGDTYVVAGSKVTPSNFWISLPYSRE